jgi:hypothetical protein
MLKLPIMPVIHAVSVKTGKNVFRQKVAASRICNAGLI